MHRHLLGTVAGLALLAGPAFAQDAAPQAEVDAAATEACAPTVTVTQTPPEVRVTLPADAGGEPVVTVIQAAPQVEVTPCEGEAGPAPEIVVNAAETAELSVMRAGGQAAAPVAGTTTEDASTGNPPASNLNTQASEAEGEAQAQAEAVGGDEAEAEAAAAPAAEAQAPAETQTADAEPQEEVPGPTGTDAEDQTISDTVTEGASSEAQPSSGGIAMDDQAQAEPSQPNPVAGELMEPAPEPQDEDVIDGPLTEPLPDEAAAPVEADPAPPQTAPLPEAEAPADMQQSDAPEGARPEGAEPLRDTAAEVAAEEEVVDQMNDGAAGTATAPAAGVAQPAASLREGNIAVDSAEAMQGDLEGTAVIASDDEEVGQIQRMTADAVVVTVGGVLGIGARDVAVPMAEVSFQRDGEGELRAYLPFASDQIEALPEAPAAE